jgi:hypothetical protein
MANSPLPMPPDFNPDTLMLAKTTEYGLFHESRRAAHFAADLIRHGTAQDIELAEGVLGQVLGCQELDERDPHFGNFYWMREDSHVEDLNAVEFVLSALIPMMLEYGERLSPATQASVLDSIRLGLGEIRRLDVLVAYTNITALDVVNTCLGGELLADDALAQRGYRKLAQWIAYTGQHGHPLEFNSPTYTSVTLRSLKQLVDLVRDEDTRIRAQAMSAKLALSVALHIHAGTGRWAGPHGRAYQPTVVCETPPEIELVREWITGGVVPDWIAGLLDNPALPFQVVETAERSLDLSLTTYQTASYALGTSTRAFSNQANVCMAHFARPMAQRPGVLYTRFILDDKWFGDAYHATDRTKTRNLPDEAEYWGVQDGNRAIGLYAPTGMSQCHSAKACLIWTDRNEVDEIWVGSERVSTLPIDIPPEKTIVVASGEAYMAVQPLIVTPLGREAPIRLVDRGGDLVLEIYAYRGPDKRFWELNWPGAFFKGRPCVGFLVEMAARSAHGDGASFGRTVTQGELAQQLAPAYTYAGGGDRQYAVSYQRDGHELGIAVDLMNWQLKRRWTECGDLGWPMMESSNAIQQPFGQIQIGDATLSAESGPIFLYADRDRLCWVAGYLGDRPTSMTVSTPYGKAEISEMGMGTVIWRQDDLTVDAIGSPSVSLAGRRSDQESERG